jgi:hypothetical protein
MLWFGIAVVRALPSCCGDRRAARSSHSPAGRAGSVTADRPGSAGGNLRRCSLARSSDYGPLSVKELSWGQFAGQRKDLFAGRAHTPKVKAEVARHWWLLRGDSWAGGRFICALVLRSWSRLGRAARACDGPGRHPGPERVDGTRATARVSTGATGHPQRRL